jgi:hypothetical protein
MSAWPASPSRSPCCAKMWASQGEFIVWALLKRGSCCHPPSRASNAYPDEETRLQTVVNSHA